jgi:hypothetical protein
MPPATSIQTHFDWEMIYEKYGSELARYEEIVQSFENEYRMQLTPGAVEIIFVPLIEVLESGSSLDQRELAETLRTVLETVANEPDGRDKAAGTRSSWSVIKAYWRNFCNIPPFCGPTAQTR